MNGLVKDKFVRDDGYHLSVDGVKVLASNLLKSLEQVLNITSSNNGQRKSPFKKRRQTQNRNNHHKD